jgi:hypothetical protein
MFSDAAARPGVGWLGSIWAAESSFEASLVVLAEALAKKNPFKLCWPLLAQFVVACNADLLRFAEGSFSIALAVRLPLRDFEVGEGIGMELDDASRSS